MLSVPWCGVLAMQTVPAGPTNSVITPTAPHELAYATLLTGAAYLPGLSSLCCSLRTSGVPLVVMTDSQTYPSVQKVTLGWRACGTLAYGHVVNATVNNSYSMKFSRFRDTLLKLQLWALPYKRVIFMDSDLLLQEPLEELFTLPMPRNSIAAAADDGKEERRSKLRFNTGLIVVQPDVCMYNEMSRLAHKLPSADGGDQGFLWSYMESSNHSVCSPAPSVIRLSRSFNTLKRRERYVHSTRHKDAAPAPAEGDEVRAARAVHFTGGKPWATRPSSDVCKYPFCLALWQRHIQSCHTLRCASAATVKTLGPQITLCGHASDRARTRAEVKTASHLLLVVGPSDRAISLVSALISTLPGVARHHFVRLPKESTTAFFSRLAEPGENSTALLCHLPPSTAGPVAGPSSTGAHAPLRSVQDQIRVLGDQRFVPATIVYAHLPASEVLLERMQALCDPRLRTCLRSVDMEARPKGVQAMRPAGSEAADTWVARELNDVYAVEARWEKWLGLPGSPRSIRINLDGLDFTRREQAANQLMVQLEGLETALARFMGNSNHNGEFLAAGLKRVLTSDARVQDILRSVERMRAPYLRQALGDALFSIATRSLPELVAIPQLSWYADKATYYPGAAEALSGHPIGKQHSGTSTNRTVH